MKNQKRNQNIVTAILLAAIGLAILELLVSSSGCSLTSRVPATAVGCVVDPANAYEVIEDLNSPEYQMLLSELAKEIGLCVVNTTAQSVLSPATNSRAKIDVVALNRAREWLATHP